MGKRKVSILEPAATAVAEIAMFIESEGLPLTAKKFVDDAFLFFAKLSDKRVEHKHVAIKGGKILTIAALLTKGNMLLPILVRQKKLLFAILFLRSF